MWLARKRRSDTYYQCEFAGPDEKTSAEAMRQTMTQIILVPHPAGERLPKVEGGQRVDWPPQEGPHRRKFLCLDGSWKGMRGTPASGAVYVWGEYEAPTFCEWQPTDGEEMPQAVQRIDPHPGPAMLNTDPWIFYPGFVWTWCRHNQIGRTRQINPGDIILFGSSIGSSTKRHWVLDTVVVVKKRLAQGIRPSRFGSGYERLVAPTVPLKDIQPVVGRPFQRIEEPFSFVPASPEGPFSRPRIDDLLGTLRKLDDDIPSVNNTRGLAICPTDNIDKFWRDLLDVVTEQKLVFGISFKLRLAAAPPRNMKNDVRGSVAEKSNCSPRTKRR